MDDDQHIHEAAQEMKESLSTPIELSCAKTATEAADCLRRRFFDLVLVDLVGADGSLAGLELVRLLVQLGLSADVAMMTHLDFDLNHTNVMDTIAVSEQPRIVRFIDKRRSKNFLGDAIEHTAAHLSNRRCELDNLNFVATQISERRGKFYPADRLDLREDGGEIAIEIDRLCRKLFAELPGGSRSTSVAVRFEPLARLGLSAAVVVRALVTLGLEGVHSSSSYECVLKIGPRDEISEEASRYVEYVRFGVRLDERVELLGHAVADSLGAIVYSMAGGSQGRVISLDELISESSTLASEVIARLFDHTNWYGVDAGRRPPREFFWDTYRTDFVKAFDAGLRPLAKACETAGGQLVITPGSEPEIRDRGGMKIILPGREFTGSGALLRSHPWCLVHGDMHGGNVMVELGSPLGREEDSVNRVSLIDYRQAGPGPRCVDAAALECAVRLNDAQRLCGDASASEEASARTALLRFKDERVLLRAQWTSAGDSSTSASPQPWQLLSRSISEGARGAFADRVPIAASEYVQTCLLYGLRQLRYPMATTPRLRIAAWVGALYEYLRSRLNPSEDTVA